jgi:ABC-2 type transport system permease protein
MDALVAGGISPEDAQTILSAEISHETETLGKDQAKNYFYTYIMIFALYMVILLYGQMVATNVANEKSSRAMELLITSARPTSMMFGKVIASCTAGLLQLVAIFGTSFVCFNANKALWDKNDVVSSLFDMPLHLLFFMLLFFVLGFLIYAFLFGAVGSTVSRLEDINTAVQPITLLFIAAFMVVMFSLASNKIDTPLMIICSYIPLTSPMAMFTRIAMSVVPWYEIAVSLTILVVSLIGVGVLSARIYRVGVLLYGTPPKPRALLQAIRDL